jgi:hypothetical protein
MFLLAANAWLSLEINVCGLWFFLVGCKAPACGVPGILINSEDTSGHFRELCQYQLLLRLLP